MVRYRPWRICHGILDIRFYFCQVDLRHKCQDIPCSIDDSKEIARVDLPFRDNTSIAVFRQEFLYRKKQYS